MRDMRDVVDSYPPASRGRSYEREEHYSSPGVPLFALIVGLPTLLFLLIFNSITDWMLRGILAGFWRAVFPWLSGICIVILLICGAVIAWHIYLVWTNHKLHRGKMQLLKQDLAVKRHTNRLIQEARAHGDNIKLSFGEDGRPKSVEIIRAARATEAQRAILVNAGQTAVFPEDGYRRIEGQPALLPPPRQPKEQIAPPADLPRMPDLPMKEIPIPVAPAFWDIAHLITPQSMPLCFVVDDDPKSPFYGETVPMFGTIDDLLSLCVIGKPGRGKTVLLMYYTLILSVYGAETHVFDPHGVMGELQLLHGRKLPGMPETARIYYYDRKETMMQGVKVLKLEVADRDKLYRPHMENGELVSRKVKHPLLILADELPILADFDDQVRAEYKERNQGKPLDEREEVPSLMYLIRRTVLEARKWRVFFIGSSQSIDATILPTKVTDALNSRIVFFNSDRKARLVGLEADVIKKMLPLIRRAGPGMTIYDCARWDEPKIGAIPNVSVEDMLEFLGVDLQTLTESWVAEGGLSDPGSDSELGLAGNGGTRLNGDIERVAGQEWDTQDIPTNVTEVDFSGRQIVPAGFPKYGSDGVVESVPAYPDASHFVAQGDDKMLPADRWDDLVYWYGKVGNVRGALEKMGITNSRYVRHASFLLEQRGLKVKRA